ncbi:MAG: carbamoyltransferase HypF [Bdellovibrio bacteriovorus]
MGERIRVRGLVQGVGFRPTVWRIARDHGLAGDVCNDGEGVLIRVWPDPEAPADSIDRFCASLRSQCPPLGRIDAIERTALASLPPGPGFHIQSSSTTRVRTAVVPDAATCEACAAEIRDPRDRRYRYPFTNCTHCGPRLSIVRAIPYDRANTSMAVFPLCPDCAAEYEDPADRRFHAQPNACPRCGPRLWLTDREGRGLDPELEGAADAIDLASRLLTQGKILAIKGIGGFHLACDAANPSAVAELRRRKGRFQKPFALMARDLDVVRHYCRVSDAEADLLASPAAPIVLLDRHQDDLAGLLAPEIAPGQGTLGMMLPYSPLHRLLLADWDSPLVMTSGNRSEEPQCIDNGEALERIGEIADFSLLHDRVIVNRVDDSVARLIDGAPRLLRRARGYAPAPIPLPPGFESAPQILAFGGELKSTACLLKGGQAILTQHLGDLEEARTAREYERTLDLYQTLFEHCPRRLAVDLHPDYRSTLRGRDWAARKGLSLVGVQHHHAHIAAVLADSGWPLDAGPVLGIALDGLGYGPDGTLWGGELLLADYRSYRRVAWLRPTPMPGGTRAILEPWRNLVAQIEMSLGWETFQGRWPDLEVTRRLAGHPLGVLRSMLARGLNSPLSSSAGRLCDAVAAALGLGGESITYEGQAAIELEALAAPTLADGLPGYPFAVATSGEGRVLDPAPLWPALFGDLAAGMPPAHIAARFHRGLCDGLAVLAGRIAAEERLDSVALSGGVFQNRLLLEGLCERLRALGLNPLTHHRVPANDGGLSLGQAAVAAALSLQETSATGAGAPKRSSR